MEELIIWKNIKEVTPKEGQQILYSYSYEYEPDKWERRVKLDRYDRSEMRKYPMCYMTHWADVPSPVAEVSEVD